MDIHTKEIAYKLLANGVLNEPEEYTLKDLFRIRDYTEGLLDYFPNEKWLQDLRVEVNKFIEQKTR